MSKSIYYTTHTVGYCKLDTKYVPSCMYVCVCVFVQIFSQGKGNRVAVENTHFVGNKASSVGAALMFQTFIYVLSRLDSHFYNFTDW